MIKASLKKSIFVVICFMTIFFISCAPKDSIKIKSALNSKPDVIYILKGFLDSNGVFVKDEKQIKQILKLVNVRFYLGRVSDSVILSDGPFPECIMHLGDRDVSFILIIYRNGLASLQKNDILYYSKTKIDIGRIYHLIEDLKK